MLPHVETATSIHITCHEAALCRLPEWQDVKPNKEAEIHREKMGPKLA